MKKTVVVLLAMAFVFTGSSFLVPDKIQADEATPSVEVAGPVKMSKKAKVTVRGTGFKPGMEVNILLTDKNGIPSDVGYALKPAPKADESGNWSTTWSCGRFIDRKLVKAGSHKITVTDPEYNPLAHTSVSFVK